MVSRKCRGSKRDTPNKPLGEPLRAYPIESRKFRLRPGLCGFCFAWMFVMITADEARALFDYNPETGVMSWAVNRRGGVRKGDPVGGLIKKPDGKRYLGMNCQRRFLRVHRLIWLWVHGEFPNGEIDHIDGNGLNNRLSNLRVVTRKENAHNQRLHSHNTSGVCGVSYDTRGKRWVAVIYVESKRIHLGRFRGKSDAEKARKMAEEKYGFHPNHGTNRPL